MKNKLLVSALLIASTTAYAEKHHDHDKHDHHDEKKMVKHDAHEHGVAVMNVAKIANEIQIELETPAYNVIGFEHKPKNHEQEEVVHEAIETLEKPMALFAIAGRACEVEHVDVDSPFGDRHHNLPPPPVVDKHDHKEHGHDEKEEETHSEFQIEYHFDCKASDELLSIDASQLFAKFPNFSEIRVQWLSNSQQGSVELSAKNTVIAIK